jgi:tetratricopeptide (TPR) repeat protein
MNPPRLHRTESRRFHRLTRFSGKTLLLVASALLLLPAVFAEPADRYYENGLEARNLNEKIKYFSIALKLNPEHSEALASRAETYFLKNRIGEAENDIEDYVERFGISERIYVLKGKIALRNGLLDKAQEFFDAALKLDETHPEAHLRKGVLLITLGRLRNRPELFDQAVAHLLKVGTASQFYALALKQATKCLEFLERYEEAQELFAILTDLEPDISSNVFNLGRLLYMNEDYKKAAARLDEACELTFIDKTYAEFYAIFRYYIALTRLDEEVAAPYHLNRFLDKLPATPGGKLFQERISPDEFLEQTLSEDRLSRLSPRRRKTLTAEIYCTLGYYFLSEELAEKALTYFEKTRDLEIFGSYYFYLGRYEHQRLKIAREMGLKSS